jgi:hypothetical protein
MFLVTFHGGSRGIRRLYSYPDAGGSTGTPYLQGVIPEAADGFRDVQFLPAQTGGYFYLANSSKSASQVLQFAPTAKSSPPPFVSGGADGVCSLYHPFGLAFDSGREVLYISNQDSNVVIRVSGPNSASPGTVMAVNPSLTAQYEGTFLPGTFVASQLALQPKACSAPPPPVDSEHGGLALSPSNVGPHGTPSNSVRGVAVLGTTLYVADEVANAVRRYDTSTGAYLETISHNSLSHPLHLLALGGKLYISVEADSDGDALVVAYDPQSQSLSTVVVRSTTDFNVKHPSGMTFDGQGNFYLADLDGQAVYQFDPTFKRTSGTFMSNMPDQPEFVLWVDDALVAP